MTLSGGAAIGPLPVNEWSTVPLHLRHDDVEVCCVALDGPGAVSHVRDNLQRHNAS